MLEESFPERSNHVLLLKAVQRSPVSRPAKAKAFSLGWPTRPWGICLSPLPPSPPQLPPAPAMALRPLPEHTKHMHIWPSPGLLLCPGHSAARRLKGSPLVSLTAPLPLEALLSGASSRFSEPPSSLPFPRSIYGQLTDAVSCTCALVSASRTRG